MLFDTKKISLTETTDAEFERRKQFWQKNNLRTPPSTLYTTIDEPFCIPLLSKDPVDDYVRLFETIFEHPFSPKLCVRTPSGWGKYVRKQVQRSDLITLAKCAAADRFKVNYLEAKFYQHDLDQMIKVPYPLNQPVLEFTESVVNGNKALVGYQVSFPTPYQQLFTLQRSSDKNNFTLVRGLWVPEEGRKVTVNATK